MTLDETNDIKAKTMPRMVFRLIVGMFFSPDILRLFMQILTYQATT